MIWKKESRAGAIREHPESKHFLSILARAEKETELAEGDCLVYVGADITPNGFFLWKENYSRPENLKQTLISIRERTLRGGRV